MVQCAGQLVEVTHSVAGRARHASNPILVELVDEVDRGFGSSHGGRVSGSRR